MFTLPALVDALIASGANFRSGESGEAVESGRAALDSTFVRPGEVKRRSRPPDCIAQRESLNESPQLGRLA